MKKKLLPLAMLAGLAGASGAAQAAYLNSDGLGQVLIFPYYTVNGGNFTNINLVNTTGESKAVKVRFLEGENSQEVLDFNLYLSPYDHWSGAVAMSDVADDGSMQWSTGDGEVAAKIVTNDTSCTAPAIDAEGEMFRNYAYAVDASDINNPVPSSDTNKSWSRTREGYVEVIEMGEIGNVADSDPNDDVDDSFNAAAAVTHVDGVPRSCDLVRNAWEDGGVWDQDPTVGVVPPTGGLYGYASIIDVAEGTNASYDAIAIDDFTDTAENQSTGSVLPSLIQALPISDVFYYDGTQGMVATNNFATGSADTVSSLFMRDTLSNDYVLDEVLNAETDWVITMPTKRFYVNGQTVTNDNGTPGDTSDDFEEPIALAPFNSPWDGATACEHIDVQYYDREEAYPTAPVVPGEIDFSPLPPQVTETPDGFQFCTEVSIMTINGGSVLDSSENLTYGLNLEDGYEHGWATIDLTNPYYPGESGADREAREIVGDANTFTGLPVVGFAVQKFENGTLEGGVLANYAGTVVHKYTRDITTP